MGQRHLVVEMPDGGEELVDRLAQAENGVAWTAWALLVPAAVLSLPLLNVLTLAALAGLTVTAIGIALRRERTFLLGAAWSLVVVPFVTEGAVTMLLLMLGLFALLAGYRSLRLLKGNRGCKGEDTAGLARSYLISVGWLGLEFVVGGATALMLVLMAPAWRFASWTVVELGIALVAALVLITYWLLRTSEDTRKG